MAVIELTQDNFESTINGNDMVIINFCEPWSVPCRQLAGIFEAASGRHPDVVFARVNAEAEQELASQFELQAIPTLVVFREQVIMFSESGLPPADALDSLIEQVMALDMAQVHQDIDAREAARGQA